MKKILIIVMLAFSMVAYGQNRSINFQTTSLTEAMKMAKEQHKMIFVDCYTVWCVPCKGMDANVFTLDTVADFFNEKFINVKLDMEKGEGPKVLKTYNVGAFPTYLLFDESGKQTYRFVGGMPANEFMSKIRVGANPRNEDAVREDRYAAGDRNHDLLIELVKQKFKQKEFKTAQDLTAEYFALMSPAEKVDPKNWYLFGEGYHAMFISEVGSVNFDYLMANYKDFVAKIGKEDVDSKINAVFKKLASNCMVGYYFKNHPYDKSEFEKLEKQVRDSKIPYKEQLIVLVQIARAGGEKDVNRAGKLLATNVDQFSEKTKHLVFDYINFCATNDRSYPYIVEIDEKVKKHSTNKFLIDFTAGYVNRLKSKKSGTNE